MEKSEFLERLLKAVREAERLLLNHPHLSLWHVAAQGGINAGFKINTNGLESENKVLLAIKGLVNTTPRDSKDHLYEMILIEKAWEYHQQKQTEKEIDLQTKGYGYGV
jgi:hypothetical protein